MQQQVCKSIDCHTHLLDYSAHQLQNVLHSAKIHNITHIVSNTTHSDQYKLTLKLLQHYNSNNNYPIIIPSFGVHPCYVHKQLSKLNWKQQLLSYLQLSDHYCIGEIGLDFRKDQLQLNQKAVQMDFFKKQLALGMQYNRPITIHCVHAYGQMLKILKQINKLSNHNKIKTPIIMHSYGGSLEITKSLLKLDYLNLYFSLSLKRSIKVCPVIPIEYLLTETDSPYQPNPQLLKQYDKEYQISDKNDVKNIIVNIKSLSEVYKMNYTQFAQKIFKNACIAFRIL